MSNIASVNQKIQIEAARFRSAVSESLIQTIGGSVNWLIDQISSVNSTITSRFSNVAANQIPVPQKTTKTGSGTVPAGQYWVIGGAIDSAGASIPTGIFGPGQTWATANDSISGTPMALPTLIFTMTNIST